MQKLNFRKKIRLILFLSLALILAVYAIASFAVTNRLRTETVFFSLEKTALSLKKIFGEKNNDLEKLLVKSIAEQKTLRLTLIDRTGKVLLESYTSNFEKENHSDRPEVIEALNGKTGRAIRYSASLKMYYAYIALPIFQGEDLTSILRLSMPIPEIKKDAHPFFAILSLIFILLILFAIVFSKYITDRISKPMYTLISTAEKWSNGDFQTRIEDFSDSDFDILGSAMNRMAEKIGESLGRLQKLETMRRDFVANVSHELRTPITLIKGFAENLLYGEGFKNKAKFNSEEIQNILQIINKNADRMEIIITDLLTLAKIENSTVSVKEDFIPTDTAFLVQSLAEKFTLQASKKNIKIRLNTMEGLYAQGSASLLEMALSNLVDNAVKYSPNGAEISITTGCDKNYVYFEVFNSGSAISEKDIPRIFERFYRADKARSRELGGTGLGLAIVKHIALIHSGNCSCSSENGNTLFKLAIPV